MDYTSNLRTCSDGFYVRNIDPVPILPWDMISHKHENCGSSDAQRCMSAMGLVDTNFFPFCVLKWLMRDSNGRMKENGFQFVPLNRYKTFRWFVILQLFKFRKLRVRKSQELHDDAPKFSLLSLVCEQNCLHTGLPKRVCRQRSSTCWQVKHAKFCKNGVSWATRNSCHHPLCTHINYVNDYCHWGVPRWREYYIGVYCFSITS